MSQSVAVTDRVTTALQLAADVVRGSRRGAAGAVGELLDALHALDPLEFIDFDIRSRSWSSGLAPGEIAKMRSLTAGGRRRRVWPILGLTSADGFERERAVRECGVGDTAAAALVILRSSDWVDQVRRAALRRAAEIPSDVLLELLPLIEHVVHDRYRAGELEPIVDARLDTRDLRAATSARDRRVRRGAWRRLAERGACDAKEWRERAARDPDVRVRAMAADVLLAPPASTRRADAELFLHDPVGWLAGRGLDALVEEAGEAAIRDALLARTSTLRRRARGWAATRGVDARAIYIDRLEAEPEDEAARVGIAEIADTRDADLLREIVRDRRGRVRAAAIRGLARVEPATARRLALQELVEGRSGRASRAAARVLADASPSADEVRALESLVLDDDRLTGTRLRALALLRRSRWSHLSTLLEWRSRAAGEVLPLLDAELDVWLKLASRASRGPDPDRRTEIETALAGVDDERRKSIEFVLRTTTV